MLPIFTKFKKHVKILDRIEHEVMYVCCLLSIVELCEPKVCAQRLRFILEHAIEVDILPRVSKNLPFDLNVKSIKETCLAVAPLWKGNTVTGGTSFLIYLNKALSHVKGKLKFEVVFHSCYRLSIKYKLGN